MQRIPPELVDRFANAFAGPNSGFSGREITDHFRKYSNLITPYDEYNIKPTRAELFSSAVGSLPANLQYYSLNDLTFFEYESKYRYPSAQERTTLREALHNLISPSPIGLSFSRIRETAFREDWVTCQTRLIFTNPPAAITAARTLLETLLKTIISERGGEPDASGNLGHLLKQVEALLGFERGERQAEHQVFSGLASVVTGLSAISNIAGDRHGTIGGKTIDDPYFANLCINAAGTVGLAFIEMHLFSELQNT